MRARAEVCSREFGGIPIYDDFITMLDATKPDTVIVTVKDSDHEKYIIQALERGYEVITEKPMTTTRASAKRILEAEKKSGKRVRVIFNMRYMKPFSDLKELICTEAIGSIKHINLDWRLDRSHGADYFRRWHRRLENTNSLLVHKSTHHFDILNWLVGDKPAEVFSRGTLEFYGKNGEYRGECCHKCAHTEKCPFYLDIAQNDFNKRYYLDVENESGYYRDGCVFDTEINIPDRMSASVKYENGVTVNYSLCAYSPDEGFTLYIMGDKGRLELEMDLRSVPGKYELDTDNAARRAKIKVTPVDGNYYTVDTGLGDGAHGGSDDLMREHIFTEGATDPLGRVAGAYDGYLSLAIGDMAIESQKSGKNITIDEL